MAMRKKATPTPRPTISGLKKMNLDRTTGAQGLKKMNLDKTATAKPTPKPSPSTFAQRSAAAEAELKKLMKQGKVKDLAKTRKEIAKKYGVSPNGFTN